eukprot:TRINITY_DN3599_c0_g8_i2.p1 TRINITY_DN3599_c0_g8~~TRINITY_DN3599_c0_g8_i2.p1  ORF type:complete len:127 (-),score=21.68 TRINITY_DN3599_c0_g8_i2:216-596(-)
MRLSRILNAATINMRDDKREGDSREEQYELSVDEDQPLSTRVETLPSIPFKLFAVSFLLVAVGVSLMVLGTIGRIGWASKRKVAEKLWYIGAVILIPGLFYGTKVAIAYRSSDTKTRVEMLSDIPI